MQNWLLYLPILCFVFTSCSAQEPKYTNQLINENSPYLLQHAHNPVDWHPWGEKAKAKAQKENKLLLISIGYAACHWCHVMEEESFEDTTVANIMNEFFVPIKVDREERPDVDAVYISACQLATGEACGWPLNVFALPDGRPVWAGTYFPKKQWTEVLDYFVKTFQESPEKMENYASALTERIAVIDELTAEEGATLDLQQDDLKTGVAAFLNDIDNKYGGRRGAPKFPIPTNYEFLLDWYLYKKDTKALEALTLTLDKMGQGGIYDHLAGGFARYSTDNQWLVPHFEKMLYDNAQLVSLYSKVYSITKDENYKRKVEETISFVENNLKDTKGGFYSSLDADSEGEEGKFYVWTKEEIEASLKEEKLSSLFCEFYQIKEHGNWEEEKNILHHKISLKEFAAKKDIELEELNAKLDQAKKILLIERNKRVGPGLDDKILCSWNALMLQGYIDAYRYLGKEEYLVTAIQNAQFLLENLKREDGALYRSYKDGQVKINAFLDDYAFLIKGLISLYEVSFDEAWLNEAQSLTEYTLAHFYNEENKFFNYTSDLDPPLIAQKLELNDKAIPASNSVMGQVLWQLSLFYYEKNYKEKAQALVGNMKAGLIESTGVSFYANWLKLYLSMSEVPYEIAIVGEDYQKLQKDFQATYYPQAIFLGGPKEGSLSLLENKLQEGATYIYVCKDKICKLPVMTVEEALKQMD